jgi:subtilisin family serine protease
LSNYGQNAGTPGADIHAVAAWDVLTSASNIVVAVLDSGIRYTHEDLAANMWVNPVDNSHGTNAVAGTTDPGDDQGHGTIMAGVLGAVGNNSKGCVGVAWQVQIMACKCFDSSGNANDSAILGCIDYAVANGARIINASFDSSAYSQSLSNAIFIASQAGVIFVTSCGNNSADVDLNPRYPACYAIDNIVSLAYTTRNDALGKYSNYGATKVHLAAPGAAIYSTFFMSDSSYLGSSFLEGTSYAAAYASGALALLCAKYPTDSYQQIIQRLLNATDPLPALLGKCTTGGRLNLQKALSPPISISVNMLLGGIFELNVFADPNRSCTIEASSDLFDWQPIVTNTTSTLGSFNYVDLSATNFSRRFYRATSTP